MEEEHIEEEKDPDTEEKNVYKKETREEQIENDEISPEEEGFMNGYDSADSEEKKSSEEE